MIRSKVWITTDVCLKACKCGAPVLYGLSEGIWTMTDPWPSVDSVTELLAWLDRRWTFQLINRQLVRRETTTPTDHVMIQHRCGGTLTTPAPTPAAPPQSDAPPF